MLHDPKKRKIWSKTSDCMFIGCASNNAAYRFLVLKSDVLECTTALLLLRKKMLSFFNIYFHFLRKVLVHPQ